MVINAHCNRTEVSFLKMQYLDQHFVIHKYHEVILFDTIIRCYLALFVNLLPGKPIRNSGIY